MSWPSSYYAPLDEMDWQVLNACQAIDSSISFMNHEFSSLSKAHIIDFFSGRYALGDNLLSQCNCPVDIVAKLENTYQSFSSTHFPKPCRNTNLKIFFIHPALLDAYLYYPLSRELHYSMVGIHPPPEKDLLSLSESSVLIDYYYNQIKKIKPHGPYHLGGWSFGGLIALALIDRFRENNEHIGSLSLIDPFFGIGERSFDFKQVFADFVKNHPEHPHNFYLTNISLNQNKRIKKYFLQVQMPIIRQHTFIDTNAPMLIIHSKDIKNNHQESISKHYSQALVHQSPHEHFNMMDAEAIHYIAPLINQHVKQYAS